MSEARLFCDVTQSWSEVGGGVGTYLRHKRAHLVEHTPHRHLMILPGRRDEVIEEGAAITVRVRSPRVPGSPQYRLLLRNRAVRAALEQYKPDLVECQDAYNLPWAALRHRRDHPATALVAGYFTDFPTVYVDRPFGRLVGRRLASRASSLAYRYCGRLYSRFDSVFGLSEHGGVAKLRQLGVPRVEVLPLGVQLDGFHPGRRDESLREFLGVGAGEPLLIYAGRLDREKKVSVVVDAFRRLPRELGARLVLLGDGPLREHLIALGEAGERISAPGYVRDRDELARWLASADIYVSGMADETFGVSIIEAQASGLPVVGVEAGAMIDRVTASTGRLGPVGDSAAMAGNILALWNDDHRAIGLAARAHVAGEFSWAHSMEVLFESIYPRAFARAEARLHSSPMQAARPTSRLTADEPRGF